MNVTQAFPALEAVHPEDGRDRGRAARSVNISSRSSDMVQTAFVAYGAGKAALNMMTGTSPPRWRPKVRVNAISVGRRPHRCARRRSHTNDALARSSFKPAIPRAASSGESRTSAVVARSIWPSPRERGVRAGVFQSTAAPGHPHPFRCRCAVSSISALRRPCPSSARILRSSPAPCFATSGDYACACSRRAPTRRNLVRNSLPRAARRSHVPNYEFSLEELWRDWSWPDALPGLGQLRRYFRHVDEKLGLSRDVRFRSRGHLRYTSTPTRICGRIRVRRRTRDPDADSSSPAPASRARAYVPDLPGLGAVSRARASTPRTGPRTDWT